MGVCMTSFPSKKACSRAVLRPRRTLLLGVAFSLLFGSAGCTAAENVPLAWDSSLSVKKASSRLAEKSAQQRPELIFSLLGINAAMSHQDAPAVFQCGMTLASSLSAEEKSALPSVVEGIVWLAANSRQEHAETILAEALQRLPDAFELISLQADFLLQNGRMDEALHLVRDAARRHQENTSFKLLLVSVLNHAGKSDESLAILQQIPDAALTPELRFSYAQLLNIRGDYSASEAQLRRALKDKADYTEASMLLALTLERRGKADEACGIYEGILEGDPDNSRCLLLLLRLCLLSGKTDKAIGHVLNSDDPHKFALSAAAVLMDEKKYQEADAFLSALEERDGLAAGLYLYHASLLFQNRADAGKALSLLGKIGEEHPDHVPAFRLKVQILTSLGKKEEAKLLLEKAMQDHPQSPEYFFIAADAFSSAKEYDAAEACYRHILTLQEGHPFASYQLAYLQELRGNRTEALRRMDLLLKKQPDNSSALNFIAYSLAEQGRELDKAYRYASKASALEPEADYIADTLAWVHYKRGEYQKAWELIQKALALHMRSEERDPVLIEHVGDIALKVHNDKAAADAWNEAARLYKAYDEFYQKVRDAQIESHEILSSSVRKVTYDNGTILYLNYGKTQAQADGVTIPAQGYAVREEAAK